MKKLTYYSLILQLILLSNFAYTMDQEQAAPAIPQSVIELRGRLHQGCRKLYRLWSKFCETYKKSAPYTRPISNVLGLSVGILGVYQNYRWATSGNPGLIRRTIAYTGIIASIIGAGLTKAFLHPGLPALLSAFRHRAEIKDNIKHNIITCWRATTLITTHEMDENVWGRMLDETRIASFKNVDEEYCRKYTDHPIYFEGDGQREKREILRSESPVTDCQLRVEEAQQRAPHNAATLALATHERLGAESPLALLDQDLLRDISQLSRDGEVYDAHKPRIPVH